MDGFTPRERSKAISIRQRAIGVIVGAAFAGPVCAVDSMLPFDPDRPLHGIVRPDDVGAVFDYLRDAYTAALEGREAPRSEALEKRADAISEELKLRGRVAGVLLLNALEAQLKELLREPPARYPLPTVPPNTRM